MQTTIVTPIPPAKWRILIVDGHSLIRTGVTAPIDGEPDLMVCAGVASGRAALEAVAASKPDLVIADLWLQGGDGLDSYEGSARDILACRYLCSRCTRGRITSEVLSKPGPAVASPNATSARPC